MLRFVVLHHRDWLGHADHYDLMLQKSEGSSDDAAVLATYSTTTDVFPTGSNQRLIVNHDHRRAYLTFEGPLSQNRGRVERVDSGILEWLDPQTVRLSGSRLAGTFQLKPADGGSVTFTHV
ncbi:MAG TPA: hypothetical protein VEJ63_16515 [Planctomycetota bacterium]|nr:hypothetical protein [Planctomycetota bacterium]